MGHTLWRLEPGLGGDYITTELVFRSTGIDIVEGAIRLALGQVPDLTRHHSPKGAAIRYIVPNPGRIVYMESLDKVRRREGVVLVELAARIGDRVGECTSSLSRLGHVVAEAPTAAEAVAIAELARNEIGLLTAL